MEINRIKLIGLAISLLHLSAAWALDSNSRQSTSFQNQRKIVEATTGTLAMIYQKGSAGTKKGLTLAVSWDGGNTWQDKLQVTPKKEVFADAVIAPNDDIYVIYATNADKAGSNNDVAFMKLIYLSEFDDWMIDTTTVVYDANSSTGAFNSVIARDDSYLWVAYRYYDGLNYSIEIRYSSDDGQTWNHALQVDTPGPNADETATFSHFEDKLALIYYHQDVQFKWRWRNNSDPPTVWQDPQLIRQLSSSLPSKSDYSVGSDQWGRMHMLFNEKGIKYSHYESGGWDANPTTLSTSGGYPTLTTNGTDLWAIWQESIGSSQNTLVSKRYHDDTQIWDPAISQVSHPSEQKASRFFNYSSLFGTFNDGTSQAGNANKGDMKHPATGLLLRDYDDAVYFGGTVPFAYLRIELSVSGAGGAVNWEYWNGITWAVFTPVSGPYHFTAKASTRLWSNADSVPLDWTVASVNGSDPLYYVRARVEVPYNTGPVGTQITSYNQHDYATSPAQRLLGPVTAWTQGISSPYEVFGIAVDPQ